MAQVLSADVAETHPAGFALERSDTDPLASFIHHLRAELRVRPEAQVIVNDDTVRIPRLSADGPDVKVFFSDSRCTLAIASWHDDLVSMDVVVEYVKLVVEGKLRVRIDRIGGKSWKHALERLLDDGTWHEESVMVIPRFSLWSRPTTTTYLRNV